MHGQGESMPRELAGLYTLMGVLTYSALYGHAHINNTNNTNHSNNNSGYCDHFDYQADSSSRYGRPVNAPTSQGEEKDFPESSAFGDVHEDDKEYNEPNQEIYRGFFRGGPLTNFLTEERAARGGRHDCRHGRR